MRRLVFAAFMIFTASAGWAAEPLPSGFPGCGTLASCLEALDVTVKAAPYGGFSENDAIYRTSLERFGRAAKIALLVRAQGSDPGWRERADAILMGWKDFDASDVPALVHALNLSPGGWIARPLGRIGTPDAMQALVADVARYGDIQNQSGLVLTSLGTKTLPYLWPMLEDAEKARAAIALIQNMKDVAAPSVPGWMQIAADKTQSPARRAASLRAVQGAIAFAKPYAGEIRALLDESDPVHGAAKTLLLLMGDDSMLVEVLATCRATPDAFTDTDDIADCPSRLAVYGEKLLPGGNLVLTRFAESHNGLDRARGALLLGYIGYRPATATLEKMLDDPDWRAVYGAARALAWLGARDAIPSLRRLAMTHWLEAVRNEAGLDLAALQSPAGALARPPVRPGNSNFPPDVLAIDVTAEDAPDVAPCEAGVWAWKGLRFSAPEQSREDVAFKGGVLKGRDMGEWGGDLRWIAPDGSEVILEGGNVAGLAPSEDGVVAVFGEVGLYHPYGQLPGSIVVSNGPSGFGYALRAAQDASGAWHLREIARLPRAADAFDRVAPDLYAAWSGGRAVMFSNEKILGLAVCVAK
ncbi:MAG: HEAT repeat domain-containing protein [Rhizomicrobium sp.]